MRAVDAHITAVICDDTATLHAMTLHAMTLHAVTLHAMTLHAMTLDGGWR